MTEYSKAISKNWPLLAICTALGLLLALGVSAVMPKKYTAESELMFSMSGVSSVSEINEASTYTMAQMPTYAALATSPLVVQPVIDANGLDVDAAQLADSVKVSQVPESVVMTVEATASTPEEAKAVAQGIAEQLVKQVQGSTGTNAKAKMVPTITAPAVAPATASSPNMGMNAVAGAFLGFLVGMLAAVVREALRGRSAADRVTPTRKDGANV